MREFPEVIEVLVFVSHGRRLVSRILQLYQAYAVRLPLKEVPNHTGLVFRVKKGSKRQLVYFEANLKGWLGPKDIDRLRRFDRKKGCWVKMARLPVPIYARESLYQKSELMKSAWHYGLTDLFLLGFLITANTKFDRLSVRLKSSPTDVTCSEAVSRILWPFYDIPADLQRMAIFRSVHDEVMPVDIYLWRKDEYKSIRDY